VIELLLEAERALSFGRVDEAERLYRQVSAADPANSIAVVGLARVALEHADDAGAYVLARQALTIDPENEAAQRLVARLDEVMRTRGETVPEMRQTHAEPAAPEEPAELDLSPAAAPQPDAPPPVVRHRSLIDRLRRR
jgi:thioredoxin-like negative regulator of GroEL